MSLRAILHATSRICTLVLTLSYISIARSRAAQTRQSQFHLKKYKSCVGLLLSLLILAAVAKSKKARPQPRALSIYKRLYRPIKKNPCIKNDIYAAYTHAVKVIDQRYIGPSQLELFNAPLCDGFTQLSTRTPRSPPIANCRRSSRGNPIHRAASNRIIDVSARALFCPTFA